jgi:enoyl-CoA hydratase/carnithine racemase
MNHVLIEEHGEVSILKLSRGKVNALNNELVGELRAELERLKRDPGVRSVILTGEGKFFSFGFDIPEFMDFTREAFTGFLMNLTGLYRCIFLFPKPVIAALNGHTIAGGCMLAMACDQRIMVTGRAKISLNEIAFGSSVFAGSVEILKCRVGHANAERILFSGEMFPAEEALQMGMVDRVVGEDELAGAALATAREFAARDGAAFASIKKLLHGPVVDRFM